MVNQESFVAKIQKTVDERILRGQLSERTLKERTDMTAQLKQFQNMGHILSKDLLLRPDLL